MCFLNFLTHLVSKSTSHLSISVPATCVCHKPTHHLFGNSKMALQKSERAFGTSMFPNTRSQLRCFDLGLVGGARPSQHSSFFCPRGVGHVSCARSLCRGVVGLCRFCRFSSKRSPRRPDCLRTLASIGLHGEFHGSRQVSPVLKNLCRSVPAPDLLHLIFPTLALTANPQRWARVSVEMLKVIGQ